METASSGLSIFEANRGERKQKMRGGSAESLKVRPGANARAHLGDSTDSNPGGPCIDEVA
ncbi:hypothetical protein K0M31_013340 [Melipona bicolor]|uniref:Uncharacterized protein n=1 Tax=Melipona bicolor TaxID=60889 RepID=A0AA40FI38_9HYME|nr:hypothetical protein K0M31_013340 [Melipona bicolor]